MADKRSKRDLFEPCRLDSHLAHPKEQLHQHAIPTQPHGPVASSPFLCLSFCTEQYNRFRSFSSTLPAAFTDAMLLKRQQKPSFRTPTAKRDVPSALLISSLLRRTAQQSVLKTACTRECVSLDTLFQFAHQKPSLFPLQLRYLSGIQKKAFGASDRSREATQTGSQRPLRLWLAVGASFFRDPHISFTDPYVSLHVTLKPHFFFSNRAA